MDATKHPDQAPETDGALRRGGLRARPSQARSRKTFDAILTAAADLLSEAGWEGFNTNLLAERAGCRVATLYRYFPDKLAVVSTLAETVVAAWDAELAEVAEDLSKAGDLRIIWPKFTAHFLSVLKHDPSALAVRKAMQAVPELRAIDQEDNRRLADVFAQALCEHLPRLTEPHATSVARVLIETEVAVIDLALSAVDEEAARLLRQIETMHLAYFDRLYADYGCASGGSEHV